MRYLLFASLGIIISSFLLQFNLPFWKHMLFAFPIFIIIYVPIRIIESLWKKLKKKHNIPEHKPLTNSQWIVAISAIAIMVTTKMVFGFPLWFIFAGAFILGIVMALASKD